MRQSLQKVLTESFAASPVAGRAEEVQLRMLCEQAEEALTDFAAAAEASDRARRFSNRPGGGSDAEVAGTPPAGAPMTWLRRLLGRRRDQRPRAITPSPTCIAAGADSAVRNR